MKVVVVGGGFAGLAAAIVLQERRHDVVLLERRGILGGRATSYRDAVSGDEVDNGSHIMVGAYGATLDLLRRAGASDLLLEQKDLRLDYVDAHGPSTLDCPPLRAPLHLLVGLLGLRVPWRVRFDALRLGLAVRFGRPPEGITLAEYFRRTGQSEATRRLLWDPLALAILNQVPSQAAAILFYNVYREAFLASRKASRLVFVRRGWAAVHERLVRYLEGRGGRVQSRSRAEALVLEGERASGVSYARGAQGREAIASGVGHSPDGVSADAVVLAVPWSAVAGLLPEALRTQPPFEGLRRLGSAPIVSVDLWVDRIVVDRPMVGIRDCQLEWVFDKGRLHGRTAAPQHLSFIVSAAYRSAERPKAELVALAEEALRRHFPAMAGAIVTRSLVLREPDATFASDPGAEELRPGNATPVPGLFLAGDWTNTGLPATIEGAVRSGNAAARLVDAYRPT
jgi:squalene-associated FAD-dependent desaturase